MDNIKGVNKIIFGVIRHRLVSYGLNKSVESKIVQFLETSPEDYPKRQKYAKEIIKSILYSHGKAQLSEEIAILGEIEEHLRPIQDKLRDHVIHAVLTFLFGIYFIEELKLTEKITPFEWKMTALLHDIAYPYEIAFYLSKKIEEHINGMASQRQIDTPILKSSNTITNLERLTHLPTSIGLLTNKFKKWGFSFSAGKLYKEMKSDHNVDHGIISSMLVLKAMDILYEHYNPNRVREYLPKDGNNWNFRNFENQIVNSCASIFMHNLPLKLFENEKIEQQEHALPFILRLSDELQDWDRITKDNIYFPSEQYSISITNDVICFHAPPSRIDKITTALNCFNKQKIIIAAKIA